MNASHESVLERVAADIFEGLAYMLSMPETDGPDSGPLVYATVRFSGQFSGALTVGVSAKMLSMLAANMLGMDGVAEPNAQQEHDALKELANVVCGNLLPELAGDRAVFDVGAPVVSQDVQVPDEPKVAGTTLALEDGVAEFTLYAGAGIPIAGGEPA